MLIALHTALGKRPEAPTRVMLHHPPFDTGIGHIDRARLFTGSGLLADVIARHSQVQRVLCGHVHRAIQLLFAGTLCQIAPLVGHQVTLDIRPDAPSCFMLEPPELLLHWLDKGRFVTHTAKVDRAPGPFPFLLPDDYPGRAR
ncbi:hypothetical protein BJF93_13575 [Xaviernesmea oryzae]|uniref:3',5'-cyclic-nucleotide phosphodiesterase n=1 Tax=Xaviernesmea oryzae TaxID=464029 RepID=A0A1Q9AR10_9HYPH|nr:hypothetical protein [Xaviernesmea oryzae]OLP57873.1 hypothetical protein BJF93_13575 [Xaviernesmea oryzae]